MGLINNLREALFGPTNYEMEQIHALQDQIEEMDQHVLYLSHQVQQLQLDIDQLEGVDPATAFCDNCKIQVILPTDQEDRAADYIQNIGWSIRDDMTLCPGCTKRRFGCDGDCEKS